MNLKNIFAGLICGCMLVTLFAGCPDRSYMRPVPDYENMRDGPQPGETEEDNDSEENLAEEARSESEE